MTSPRTAVDVYIAGPFFKPHEAAFVAQMEALTYRLGLEAFSPRQGENSRKMNKVLQARREWLRARGYQPRQEVRPADLAELDRIHPVDTRAVFDDNVAYIETCRVIVCYTDDFDPGTMMELGMAYAHNIPIITVTNQGYGTNLMLVHSIVAHCRGIDELEEALLLARPLMSTPDDTKAAAEALARLQARFLQQRQGIEDEGELR